MRIAIAAICLVVSMFAAGGAAAQSGDNRHRLNLREPLILELRLGNLMLSDAFPAMLSGSSLELPLGDLARALDFSITADAAAGIAGGWFIAENRLFSLSLGRREVVIEGRPSSFDPALVHVADGDIYVDVRLLSRWFPIDVSFDLPNLTATLTSREPMPIEARLAREETRERALRQRRPKDDFPLEAKPPALISIPRADIYTQGLMATHQSQNKKYSYTYNVTAAADVAGTDASVFISGKDGERISDIRTTFTRTDLDGGLGKSILGDYGATQIQGGDIYTPQYALTTRNQVANGVTVGNFEIGGTPDEFDRITLTGDLPLGWEMEVYRNETLIDFAEARSDGRYEFTDVPLLFGVNVLRLVFYGPQGQIREETRQVRVGLDQIKPGEVKYEMSAGLHDDRLIGNQVVTSDDSRRDQARVMARVKTGLTRNLSLGGSLVAIPTDGGGRDTYLGTTLAGSFGNLFAKVDLVDQQEGGWASRFTAQTSIMGFSTILEHNITKNFVSEQFTGTGTSKLNSSTTLRVDGSLSVFDLPQMPISLTVDHDRYVNGDKRTTLSNRMTVPIGRMSVTHTFDYSRTKSASTVSKSASGTFLLGGRIGSLRLRGTVGYTLLPEKDYGAITLTAEQRISKDLEVKIGLDRTAPPAPVNTYSLGINKLTDWSAWGVDLEYSDSDVIQAKVNMSMSLGVNPASYQPYVRADRAATQGALLSRIYLDANGNGKFDEDEDKPLEGVQLEVDRGVMRPKTDAEGFLFLPSVSPNRKLVVKVDTDSLRDPFLVPLKKGVTVVANPGGTARIDFAVVTTGEIDGTVFKVEGDKVFPVSGAEVQLLDEDGTVIRDLRSAFDGFYLMEYVPPGKYTVRVNPDQLARLNLVADDMRRIEIEGDGTIRNGQDLTLRRPSERPAPDEGRDAPSQPDAFPNPRRSMGADPASGLETPLKEDFPDGSPVPKAAPVVPVTTDEN